MPVNAMRLSRIDSREPISPEQVLLVGYRLKVGGVHAPPNATEVVKVEAIRDFSVSKFVGKSVRSEKVLARHHELPVPVRSYRCRPEPA